MYYRVLGNTGLQVSVFSYGFWATFGVKEGLLQDEGVKQAKDILRVVRKAGVNLFDNAEAYGEPNGEAERIMGRAIEELAQEDPELWRRSDIIITTKLFWGGKGVNETGLSKKHIMEGAERSLKNLRLDYVDLMLCHRPDPFTPTATVVRAMTDLVRSGKATSWGTSEWSAAQIVEAYWIATTQGLEPPQYEQPQYNMMCRDRFEKEYDFIYKEPYNIGTTIWSPLASGFLTGKYQNGIPEGSRLTQTGYEWLHNNLNQWKSSGKLAKVDKLMEYAKTLDCSVGQLALAWCAKNKRVSTVLLGATKVEQIEENLGALKVLEKLTDANMKEINEILGNEPEAMTFRRINTI